MSAHFDAPRVTRLIALGKPPNEVLPLFLPLIKGIIHNSVAYDEHNHSEDDLVQVGLIKCQEIIDKFHPSQGNLFAYASTLLKHAIWTEARLRPLDRKRDTDEIDFDTQPTAITTTHSEPPILDERFFKRLRLEGDSYKKAAIYIYGVLLSNDYESNRARVLKTLSNGYDINLKQARFLVDHVLVALRRQFSKGALEIRDDPMFLNRYKQTLVPELREILGEKAFELLLHFFGGVTIYVPSVAHISSIDRDLFILKALANDWLCGPTMSKKFGISPEGIKAVYKNCIHKLHSDPEYARLISMQIPLSLIPGAELTTEAKEKKRPIPGFGEKKIHIRRKVTNTDSMGFMLGCRNSLLYTLIITGRCTRPDLVTTVLSKFGGTESAAKATVSAFLSDIKHPFGRFNTSRNLKLITDPANRLSFDRNSLIAAQDVISIKRKAMATQEIPNESRIQIVA